MQIIEKEFEWSDPKLELRLRALNVPQRDIDIVMEHKGKPFNLFIRESISFPITPAELWRFS